jgi:hypothetical protein
MNQRSRGPRREASNIQKEHSYDTAFIGYEQFKRQPDYYEFGVYHTAELERKKTGKNCVTPPSVSKGKKHIH